MAASFALLAIWQISEAMVPVVVGMVIDRAVAVGSFAALLSWGGLLVLVFVSLIFAYRYGALGAYRIDQRENHRLRVEIAGHVLRPLGARTGMLPGTTLSLATADTESVGDMTQAVSYAFASAMAVAVSAIILLRIDTVIGLVVLIGVPLMLAATQVTSPVISRRSRAQRAEVATTSGAAADLIRGLRIIKGIGAEDEATARYRARSQLARSAGIRLAGSTAVMHGLSAGLSGLFLAGVTLLAGHRALDHAITIGQLIAIVGLTQFLAVPIRAIGQIGAKLAAAYASAARIADFFRTPPLLAAGAEQPLGTRPELIREVPAELILSDVSIDALRWFSAKSRVGEMLCLVIDDPAATRTLVRLLAGEIPAEGMAGDVLLNGITITELSVRARSERLLVSPHRTDLIEGTLRDNLDPHGRHGDADLTRILDAAAARDILKMHEHGLDQPVAADGMTYSGGQRQRIALARALAADPPILLLDNPTTAVDAVTEQQIAAGIRGLRHLPSNSRTTWIITTSPALLALAQRVVFVANGRVADEGTHESLIRQPGYQELVLR